MLFVGVVLAFFVPVQVVSSRRAVVEPQCSPYDFFERTLDKVLRVEHAGEQNKEKMAQWETAMTDKLKLMEQTLVDELNKIQNERKVLKEFRDSTAASLTEYKDKTEKLFEDQKSELLSVKEKLEKPKVVFTSKDATVSSLSVGSTVVFPTTVENVGGGYNNVTGVFTAPVDGTYAFDVQFCMAYQKSLYINIMAADKVITASRYGQDYYSCMCHTSHGVTVLKQGEEVRVVIGPNGKDSGNIICKDNSNNYYWTMFSGFLLH